MPPAGPRWLTEGMAEYLAHLGADAAGLIPYVRTRATWVRLLAETGTPLRAFENLRGFQQTPQSWAVSRSRSSCSRAGAANRRC